MNRLAKRFGPDKPTDRHASVWNESGSLARWTASLVQFVRKTLVDERTAVNEYATWKEALGAAQMEPWEGDTESRVAAASCAKRK